MRLIFCEKKSDFEEVAEAMFYVWEWLRELIICHANVLKNDFVDVDETIFEGFERPCELISCVLGIQKRH
jgi:hypothetical protein